MDGVTEVQERIATDALENERRFGHVENRLTRLETLVDQMPTHDDMANFRVDVATLQETVKKFATIAESVATKTDVLWIKGFVWKAITAISSLLILVAGIVLSHIVTGHP